MRTHGESPTYAVHTAQFVGPDRYLELYIVGKLRTTREILKQHQVRGTWRRRGLEVWRSRSLIAEQHEAVSR